MRTISDGGIGVDLPTGWDAQIVPAGRSRARSVAAAGVTDAAGAVLHAANFSLPPNRGDFGSGAVEVMGGSDVLVCLLEGDPADAASALYRHQGVPALALGDFSPQTMQRAVPGMAGAQHFFTVGGRAFCLYVVVGTYRTRGPLVRAAAEVVRSIRITPSAA
jgi:hypothetical protein